MRRVYLDYAAAVPASSRAMRVFAQAQKTFANPSSPHEEGRAARELLEDARTRIARLASVKADAVVFTSGATEANNLAIVGHIEARIALGEKAESLEVLFLPSAHASTRETVAYLARLGVSVKPVPLIGARIDTHALAGMLTPKTILIALEAVCGETGTRFDTRDVRRVVNAYGKGASQIRIHVDASQLPCVESFACARLGADTLALDAQKVGGVRGIGVLIAPRTLSLAPRMFGGGQERGLRPGTESPALAQAFAVALEDAQTHIPVFLMQAKRIRTAIMRELVSVSGWYENGDIQVPHILNLSFEGRDTEYLAALLNAKGYAVSTKSACATDSPESVAVYAFTQDTARAQSTLRISWGKETRLSDIERFVRVLTESIAFLDAHHI